MPSRDQSDRTTPKPGFFFSLAAGGFAIDAFVAVAKRHVSQLGSVGRPHGGAGLLALFAGGDARALACSDVEDPDVGALVFEVGIDYGDSLRVGRENGLVVEAAAGEGRDDLALAVEDRDGAGVGFESLGIVARLYLRLFFRGRGLAPAGNRENGGQYREFGYS